MSPNSNGFYKSKVFKFVNRQYQKISEKSVIALRYLKIAFESALQAIAYSAQMLVGKIKKITGKDSEVDRAEKSFGEGTKKSEIPAATTSQAQTLTAQAENKTSLLEFKKTLSTPPVSQNVKSEKESEEDSEIDYQELQEFTQELRQELDVYIETDQKPAAENLSSFTEEKAARTEEIQINKENWVQKVDIEKESGLNSLEASEEISWLEQATENTEFNTTKTPEQKPTENWLEEIEELAEQTTQFTGLEEKETKEISNFDRTEEIKSEKLEFSETKEKNTQEFQFDELEEIAKQTNEFERVEEDTDEFEIEKEKVNFNFEAETKQSPFQEKIKKEAEVAARTNLEFETEKEEPVSQSNRSQTQQQETNNYPQEEAKEELKNLAIVPTKREKKLIPTLKEYASDLFYIGVKLTGKLGATAKVLLEKAIENIGQQKKLATTLEKGKIVFRETTAYLADKFGEYYGKIKVKIDELDLKSIDLNKSLNLGNKEGKTNLELKSYILSGIQNYVRDIDVAYEEIKQDSDLKNDGKQKIAPDWLETKATSLGYVKQPLEVILTIIDRALFWIEEILAAVWVQIRKIIAKIKDKR
ncbi:MAG: hypothetical protein ACFBSE_19025 [Prochloraceae cyanobacterium]